MFHNLMKWSCVAAVVLLLAGNGAWAVDILDGTGSPDLSFSGFELWLDASDVNADGIADSYMDGTEIYDWTDKTHYYMAGNPYGINIPTVNTVAAVNNMPVVTLDEVELDMPLYTSLNPGTDPFYVFAVGASFTEGDDDSVWVRQGNQYSMSEGWSVMAGYKGAAVRAGDGVTRASQTSAWLNLGDFGLVTMALSGVNGVDTPTITGALSGMSSVWVNGGIGPTTNEYSESIDSTDPFYVGRADAKSQIAEVLVYRGALTATQIADVEGYLRTKYAIQDPEAPPVGDVVVDQTGNGYDGTFRGTVNSVTESVGGLDQAYSFEEGYIQTPNPGESSTVLSAAMTTGTISGYVKFNADYYDPEATNWSNAVFLGSSWNNGTARLEIDSLGNLRTAARTSSGARSDISPGFESPVAEEWYHVAYSFGVETEDPNLSKTMLVVTDSEGNVSTFDGAAYDATLTFDLTDLCIAGMSMTDGADRDSFLDGLMNDIRIYGDALSLEDIALLADDDFYSNPVANLLAHYYTGEAANPQIAGDANKDGKVDGSDVTILAGNWQKGVNDGLTASWEEGDFNGDGKVDGSDVTILAGNWQYGVEAAASAVPEPSMLVLILGAMLTGWIIRRK